MTLNAQDLALVREALDMAAARHESSAHFYFGSTSASIHEHKAKKMHELRQRLSAPSPEPDSRPAPPPTK